MAVSVLHTGAPTPGWLTEAGPESDVVVSTRCRLARNLAEYPFPWRASERQRRETAQRIHSAVDGSPAFDRASRVERERLPESEIRKLIEMRVVSPEWWALGTDRWAVISQDGVRSLLMNEEDHIRLQAILPGLQVEFSLRTADEAERQLAQRLDFAWQEGVGFLTASLSNAGTGLRLGVMLHLPALSATDGFQSVLSAATELGCAVRGVYGEGTAATGAFYQVSNTRACFVETYRIVDRVRASALYLIEAERAARRAQFADEAGRQSLREATADILRLLFQEEAAQQRLLGLVSVLRLSAAEGVLPVDLAECAAWITIAGASPAPFEDSASETSFQAIQRTAAIRHRVRRALGNSGTSFTGIAD